MLAIPKGVNISVLVFSFSVFGLKHQWKSLIVMSDSGHSDTWSPLLDVCCVLQYSVRMCRTWQFELLRVITIFSGVKYHRCSGKMSVVNRYHTFLKQKKLGHDKAKGTVAVVSFFLKIITNICMFWLQDTCLVLYITVVDSLPITAPQCSITSLLEAWWSVWTRRAAGKHRPPDLSCRTFNGDCWTQKQMQGYVT